MESLAEVRRAEKLDTQSEPLRLVAIASGKGGVGKTMACFGMGWYLAKVGYRVVAVDMDFGVGNLHLSAGLGRPEKSLDDFLDRRTDDLNELLTPLEDNPKLLILAAGGRRSSATRLNAGRKQDLLAQLHQLDADIVLLDIGAGSSQDNIDYFIHAEHQIAVATADLSAMMALITFLKKAQIHNILSDIAQTYPDLAGLAEFSYTCVSDLYLKLNEYIDETRSRTILQQALKTFRPTVVLNRIEEEDLAQVQRVSKNLMRQLNATTTVLGTIPEDASITYCRRRGQNFLYQAPECDAAKQLAAITHQWHERYCSEWFGNREALAK